MAVTIQLPPHIEAELMVRAQAQGLELAEYVEGLLRDKVSAPVSSSASPAERAAAWRESTRGLPHTPPLTDEAISRENIYGNRGG